MKLRVGTRGSKLALTQTGHVVAALEALPAVTEVEIIPIKTLGCRKQGTERAKQSDKKDWVYDLEIALLNGEIDLAVHSGKDCPTDIEEGTFIHSVLQRGSSADCFIGKVQADGKRLKFENLPQGAKVGTASLRRKALLLLSRPDLEVVEHRGNVPTRLRKLDESDSLSGIILAEAGLKRLEITELETEKLDPETFVPALGQGTLVVQLSEARPEVAEVTKQLCHNETEAGWKAERACAELLGGDCKSAVGIHSEFGEEGLKLTCRVMLPDASKSIEEVSLGDITSPAQLGRLLGEKLKALGSDEILAQARTMS